MHHSSSFLNDGPTAHWIGPKTLVDIVVEGREAITLADSGSQVNVVTPTYVKCHEFPILPLEELVDHQANLVGLGGGCTSPLGFIILQVCMAEVTGYDEDIVFLTVPDESEFSRHVPLVLGTCMLCRIINVIRDKRESEINRFSVPWAMTQKSHLLSRHGTTDLGEGAVGGAEEPQTPSAESTDKGIDEPILVKEHVKLGPLQTQILECKVKPLLRETALMMVCPIGVGETQFTGTCPLHPGLHVLHTLTRLKMGSGKVSVVVCNMLDSPIYLKKGMRIVRVESTLPVPPAELSPEVQAALGKEMQPEPLLVAEQLEKLNLDSLSSWTLGNAAVARELVLTFHDIFALDDNGLGCMSVIEHEIHITDSEPFKEWFRQIPPSLLVEVRTSLRDMLEAGAIHPSESPWCNVVVLVHKKDGSLCFCVDFHRLNVHTRKDSYPLPRIQEALESMAGVGHFSMMDFKSGFGKSAWCLGHSNILPSPWGT